MLSTPSTPERKLAWGYVREWTISHNVEILYEGEPVDKHAISKAMCSLKRLTC